MLFNSPEFLVFLIIVYVLYRLLWHPWQNLLLLFASYLFYGWWDIRFLFLIVVSTAIDFCAGLLIDQNRIDIRKRLSVSIYVILSSFFFVVFQWSSLKAADLSNQFLWKTIFLNKFGWYVFFGSVALVILGNVIYPLIVSLKEHDRRKLSLTISIFNNLLLLSFFKYYNFFVDSAEFAFESFGINSNLLRLNVILPVGISFYTFQTMSYTIDVYRGKLKATDKLFDFALFVSYFPQLVAGPIERASHLLPSILNPRKITQIQIVHGIHLILIGFFKKVAIADGVANSVEQVYSSSGLITSADILFGTLLFAIQIYCDFSGYSDIARGVSSLFGIDLMVNFRTPYLSRGPKEFWQRWHISLSTWLRDYLYIPLGGSRVGAIKIYRNLMTTMILGGLWHGAGWNFILWGIYQGTLLCCHRFWMLRNGMHIVPSKLINFISIILFMPFILYGWLLFRASSFSQIVVFSQELFSFSSFSLGIDFPRLSAVIGIPLLAFIDSIEYLNHNHEYYYQKLSSFLVGALYASMIFTIILGLANEPAEFIYFDF